MFDYRSDTSAAIHFSAFSPTVSIGFNVSGNSFLYATFSRGYRVGGLTPLSSDPSQPALYPFRPEYSNNIELGAKNSFWNHKLIWNIAAFYSTISDAQVPTLILPDAVTITKNTGRLTSKGIETEVMAKLFKGLEVNASLGYTDAQYNNLKIAQGDAEANLKGKRQLFTPDVTSMLAMQYTRDVKSKQNIQLVVRGEWLYTGMQYFDLANTISQKGYSLLNAKAGITTKHFGFMLWTRNLADKYYISYAYDFGAVHLGNPKTYGVTVNCMF